jgi:hypothetical protein
VHSADRGEQIERKRQRGETERMRQRGETEGKRQRGGDRVEETE